jgi:hypothetical protein
VPDEIEKTVPPVSWAVRCSCDPGIRTWLRVAQGPRRHGPESRYSRTRPWHGPCASPDSMTWSIRLFPWTALGLWSPLAALLAGLAGCSTASSTPAADGGSTAPTSPSDAGASSGTKGTVLGTFGTPPLFALWGSGSQDIWLVGGTEQNIDPGFTPGFDGAPGPPPGGRIVHFQGDGWSDVQAPSPFALFAVWGSAANDVWAGGGDSVVSGGVVSHSGVVLHYDGMAWSQVSQLKDYVSAIWGSSSSDVWFAGGLSIWHWNGSAITPVSAPKPPDGLLSLWGFSASDAWVGGANGGLMHWDGSSWNPIATNGLYIYGLWGASPTDLWGVGNDGYQLHWDGTTVKNTSQGFTGFNAIYGLSGSDIWALGSCCWEDGGPAQAWGAHYDGARWTYQGVPGIDTASALWATPPETYFALVNNTLVRWP